MTERSEPLNAVRSKSIIDFTYLDFQITETRLDYRTYLRGPAMSPPGKRFDAPRARRQSRDGTRRKTSFVPALVSLESRSLLSVVHPAAELHSRHSARQTIVRGTIHGQYTVPESNFPLSTTDYSGQGTASHLGRITYIGQDTYFFGPGFSQGGGGPRR
jgi:hypothetical protein